MTDAVLGKRFGNYQAVSLLGQGGMGAVYLAEHPQIGRKAAIKVLRNELAQDPDVVARFLNEARAANAIRHPNIIDVVDCGTTADGQAYLTMELLRGEELSRRLKRLGRLSLEAALEIAYQTASALAAAHRAGIVHRDLKPDNLFIVEDAVEPDVERVKVLDFGIAKLHEDRDKGMVKTRTGALLGTPVYMSPEQCLGTRTLNAQSDVYSLGCILYEMLAGRPPFLSEGLGELITMHISQPHEPLLARVPGLPATLSSLVDRMLAKEPTARPAGMPSVLAELKGLAPSGLDLQKISASNLQPPAGLRESLATSRTVATGERERPAPQPSVTTLSSHSGERAAATRPRKRLAPRVVMGAGVLGAALATAFMLGRSEPRQDQTRHAPVRQPTPPDVAAKTVIAPAAATKSIRIESVPPGATVITTGAATALGTTPFTLTLAGDERRSLRLTLAGHAERLIEIAASAGSPQSFTLEPLPAVAPAVTANNTTGKRRKPNPAAAKPTPSATPAAAEPHEKPAIPEPAKL